LAAGEAAFHCLVLFASEAVSASSATLSLDSRPYFELWKPAFIGKIIIAKL